MFREIIALTPVYVPLFWALVFLTDKFSANRARFGLGVFMFLSAILYACHATFFIGFHSLYLKIDSIYLFSGLSVFPLYYLYVRLLTCDLSIQWGYLYHFVPAAALSLLLLVLSLLAGPQERGAYFDFVLVQNLWPQPIAIDLTNAMALVFFVSRMVFGIQVVGYLFAGYGLVKKYDKRVANFYSNLEGKELVWVKLLTTSFLITSIISFLVNMLGRGLFFKSDLLLAVVSALFSSLFFIIGLQGNKQNFTIKSLKGDEENDLNAQKNRVEPRNEKLKQGLLHLLENDKIFLESELKITELCRKLSTNRTYLSNLINSEFQVSFNDLINRYRVKHAISLMGNGRSENTLDHIASASGFGSLRSFNRAFKRHTGVAAGSFRLPSEIISSPLRGHFVSAQ